MQYIAVGDAAVAQFVFYKNGVPTTPAVAPTITAAYYPPNGTLLSPLPAIGSPTNPGEYTPQVFSAAETLAAGAGYYSATAYTSDTTMDNQVSIEEWTVGLAADPTSIAAAVMDYLKASVTTAGSWAKYVSDTLASILSRTSPGSTTFRSSVARDLTTTIYYNRDLNTADGLSLIYPVNVTLDANTDTVAWNATCFDGSDYTVTGSVLDDDHIEVNVSGADARAILDTDDAPINNVNFDTEFEAVITRSGRQIESVKAALLMRKVVKP